MFRGTSKAQSGSKETLTGLETTQTLDEMFSAPMGTEREGQKRGATSLYAD